MSEVTSSAPLLAIIALALLVCAIELYRALERRRNRYYADYIKRKHRFSTWRWSQDGWVRRCRDTGVIQYGGDDYNAEPNELGPIK